MSQYPYILIPDVLQNLQVQQWEKPKEPLVPIKPVPPNPLIKPQKLNFLELLILLFIGLMLTFLLGMSNPTVFYTGIGITSLSILFRCFQQFRTFSQKFTQYKADLPYFKFKQENYLVKLAKFEQQQITYPQLQQEFNNKLIIYQQIQTQNYRQLQTLLSDLVTFDGVESKARQGDSEKKFKNHLKRFFGKKIKTRLWIQNPAYSKNYHYTPDFTYIDKETNLHIDIEIDEPYHYTQKFPLHYLELETQEIRDDFFLDCLWIVIRFSEEQVIKYPNCCCKEVAKVISKLTGDLSVLYSFKEENDLEPIKRWNEEEAIIMADNNYRDNYLLNRT